MALYVSIYMCRAYAYGLQRSFYGPMTSRSKVTYLRFSLCKRPQREQYKSYAEVGNTTEGSELPRFVKSCHMRKPCLHVPIYRFARNLGGILKGCRTSPAATF